MAVIALLILIFLTTYHPASCQVRCYASTDCRGGVVEVFAPRMQGDRRHGDCCGGRGLSFTDSGIQCQNCFREEAFTGPGDEFFLAFFNNRRFLPEQVRRLSKIRISVGAMEDNVEFMVDTEKETQMLTTGTSPEPMVVTLMDESLRLEDSGDRDGAVLVKSMGGQGLSVIALAEDVQSSDSFKSIPCVFLPDFQYEYYIVSVPNSLEQDFLENAQGAFVIIPSEDATITLQVTTDVSIAEAEDLAEQASLPENLQAGIPVTFILSRMQTLYISARDGDLTGSRILSDKPLSVITGHECGNVPSNREFCDQLAEQVPPTTTWGTRFITAPFAGRTAFDMFRVLAVRNNTSFNGSCANETSRNEDFQFTLLVGEWEEFMIHFELFCYFESTEPVLLVQFSIASTTDNVTFADPFMVIVPPVEQYQNSYLIDTLSSTRDVMETSYINIFVPLPYDRSDVLLDGRPIPERDPGWIEIFCTDGESTCAYGRQVEVDAGAHILNHSNPEAQFNAIVYWFSFRVAHGYFAGMTQRPITLPTVTLESDLEDVFENATSVIFNLTRTGDLRQTSTVFILTRDLENEQANRTARAGTDYTALNSMVEFHPGQQTQLVEVEIIDDVFPEENKTFEVFLAASPGVYLTPFAYTVVRIRNDDPPLAVMNVSFANTSVTVREGMGIVEFVLRKTERAVGNVSVRIMTMDGTANGGEDYDPIEEIVTFGVEDLEARVTTLILDNLALEERESFTAEIFPVPGPFPVAVINSTTTVLIEDNDIVVIGFMPVVYNVEESEGSVSLMVVLQFGTLARDVTINVFTVDGSATASSDYVAVSRSVLFTPSTPSRTITVSLLDDSRVESSEDFAVRLELEDPQDGNNVVLLPNEASVTITDNDRTRIGLEVSRNRVDESERSVQVIVRVLEGNLRRDVVLGLSTLSRNASAVDDFQSIINREITLTPEAQSRTVDVGIVNDRTPEEIETFMVLLSVLSGDRSVGIEPNSAEIAITDNDQPLTQILCFTQSQCSGIPLMATSVQECCANFRAVTFRLDATVDFCQTCILIGFAQREYTLEEGPRPHRLQVQPVRGFLPQDMTLTVTAMAGTASVSDFQLETQQVALTRTSPQGIVELTLFQEDSLDDAEFESLTLRLSDEFGFGTLNLLFRDAQVNIQNIVVRVGFATTEYTVREGDEQGGVFLLIASNGHIADPLLIQLTTQDGTAIAGEDYTALRTSLTLEPGQTQQRVLLPIINDRTLEPLRESLTVELTAEGEAIIITSSTATVTILDGDEVDIGFSQSLYIISEDAGSVTITVEKSGTNAIPVSIAVSTVDGTAAAGEDYGRVVSQTLIFGPTDQSQTLRIPLIDNNIHEATEQFIVRFEVVSERGAAATRSEATVSIDDNDPVTIGFDPRVYSAQESSGEVIVSVRVMSGQLDGVVEVQLSFLDGTATSTSPRDYINPGVITLQFDNQITVSSIRLLIIDDSIFDTDETFIGRLVSSDPGVILNPAEATINIIEDNDGLTADTAAPSCKQIAELDPSRPSGYYWVRNSIGTAVRVYCDMTRECCGTTGGWTRVAFLDMSDPSQQCPSAWQEISSPIRTCGRLISNFPGGCDSVIYSTQSNEYSRVCGRVIGYQHGDPDAFRTYIRSPTNVTVDDLYLDGVSITYGSNPRQHIWSFVAAYTEDQANSNCICPCTNTNEEFTHPIPPWVENAYFCETAHTVAECGEIFYANDPLWDGTSCGPFSTCCSFNSPPWFCQSLDQPTTEDIEVRLCTQQDACTGDVPIELIEIYVQ